LRLFLNEYDTKIFKEMSVLVPWLLFQQQRKNNPFRNRILRHQLLIIGI